MSKLQINSILRLNTRIINILIKSPKNEQDMQLQQWLQLQEEQWILQCSGIDHLLPTDLVTSIEQAQDDHLEGTH